MFDLTSCLLCLVVFLIARWYFVNRYTGLPPGPLGWPILGSILDIRRNVQGLHAHMSSLVDTYGEVLSIRMGTRLIIVLNSLSVIREAYMKKQLNDRPSLLKTSVPDGYKGIVLASGDIWHEQRRFGLGVLRYFGVTSKKASLESRIQEESRYLVEEFDRINQTQKAWNPAQPLMNAVSNIICSLSFGERMEYTSSEFNYILKRMDDIFTTQQNARLILFIPILRNFSSARDIMFRSFREINAFIQKQIDSHRETFDPEHTRDFIDAYLKELENENGKLDDENMVVAIRDFFFGGTETTSTTLSWALLYMITNIDVQTAVQEEIDNVLGRGRPPCLADQQNLPYTSATILEILRMSSLISLSLPHSGAEDIEINGYRIPKDTVIWTNWWHIAHDPKIWPEPNMLKPERFLDENGKVKKIEEFIPFGVGPRICLGEQLAKMELFLFFATLMQQFSFKIPEGAPTPSLTPLRASSILRPMPYELCATLR